jgi:hypothetical protein
LGLFFLAPRIAFAAPSWNFETIKQMPVPVGCSAPEVRLTGLDYDLPANNRPIAGWSEKDNCTASPLTQSPKWARKDTGVWVASTLGTTPFSSVPELTVNSGGVPFYLYAAPGTGGDSGNAFVWRADLNVSSSGPGVYTGPTDLLGSVGSCTATPFISADFTPSNTLNWARGATCATSPGPVKLNTTTDIITSKSILALDYATGPAAENHVVFYDGTSVFYSSGGVSSAASIRTTAQLRGLSITADGANTVHLVLGGVGSSGEGTLEYMALPFGSTTWTQETLDAAGGRNPSIAIDPSGNPCVSYWQASNQVRFGCRSGVGWNPQQVTSTAAGSNSVFSLETQTRLIFDHATSPKPAILAYRPSSDSTNNPSGFELLLLTNPDLAPVVTQPADQQNNENDLLIFAITATDEPGDSLTYSATGLPPGLQMGAGQIAGQISFSAAQPPGPVYNVTVFVSDGTLVSSKTFQWTITNVNRIPAIACPATNTLNEGTTISPSIQVPAGDLDNDALTYGLTVVPSAPWLTIAPSTGAISGLPSFTAAGSYTLTLSVSDSIAPAVTVNCVWTVNNVNGAPSLSPVSVSPVGDQINDEGDVIPGFTVPTPGLQVVATDPDGDSLKFSATGLPDGLTISSGGLITGTLSPSSPSLPGPAHIVKVDACEVIRPTVCGGGQFLWTVKPINQPPTVTAPTPAPTHDEGTTIVPLQIIANDPDPNTTLTFTATGLPTGLSIGATGLITGTLPFNASGVYSVKVSAFDGIVSDAKTFSWTIVNKNAPPVVINPGPQVSTENASPSLQILASDPDNNPASPPTLGLTYSITGLPAPPFSISATGLISATAPLPVGSYTVTVRVTDVTPQFTETIFTWLVTNVNQQPVFTNPCPPAISEGVFVSYSFGATDVDGDTLQYSATLLPPPLVINTQTGEVTGTPSFTTSGSHNIIVTVTDNITPSVPKNCTWVVNNSNGPPTLIHPGDQSTGNASSDSLQLTATDPDIPAPGDTLTFSLVPSTSLPQGFSLSPTGLISVAPPTVAGTYTIQVRVTDGGGSFDDESFRWVIGGSNAPPTFATPPPNQTSSEQNLASLQIQASDPDGHPITYKVFGLPTPTPTPTFTVSASGLIEWTPTYVDAGVYTVTVIVSETTTPELFSVQQTFTWTVLQTNRPPAFDTNPGTQNSAENQPIDLHIEVSDPDITFPNTQNPNTIDTLSCSAGTTLPPGPSVAFAFNAITGKRTCHITGTITFSAVSHPNPSASYAVLVKVTDSAGAPTNLPVTWNVSSVNRPPSLEPILNQESTEGQEILPTAATPNVLALEAADPDLPGDTLTFNAIGLPPGMMINAATGDITGSPNQNDTLSFTSAGTYPVEVCVEDAGGLVGGINLRACQSFQWAILPANRAPTLTPPAPQISCEGDEISLFLSATDPDLGDQLTFSGTTLPAKLFPASGLGLKLDASTGRIFGVIPFDAAKSYLANEIRFKVTDNGLPEPLDSPVITFTWNVCDTNREPTITAPPALAMGAENVSFSLDINASDPDIDPLTFSASGLPTWLLISPTTGIISGVPPFTSAASYPLEVCVQDRVSTPLVCHAFTLTITNTNRSPLVTNPGPKIHTEDQSLSFPILATDQDTVDRGDILTFSATNLPLGISINPVTGVISGTLTLSSSERVNPFATVLVNDGKGGVTTVIFRWDVTHNRPCERTHLCHRTIVPADGRKVPIRVRRVPRGATVVITKITQDEPTNPAGGDGTTIDAGGIGRARGWVRAELGPGSDGRVYEIFFTLTERSGRKYNCSLIVTVPASGQKINSRGTAGVPSDGYDSRLPST